MFKGTVSYRAEIDGMGLKFPLFDYKPTEPAIEKVEIEGPNGDHILVTVHFSSIAAPDDARPIAAKAATAALDRLSYHHGITIGNPHFTGHNFNPVNPTPGTFSYAGSGIGLFVSGSAPAAIGLQPGQLKPDLEDPTPTGGRHFPLFRSALLSGSPVETFMHLYNLLLMLYGDNQGNVDGFIRTVEPAVPQTPSPKFAGVNETLYTRLRNEFAHVRVGVDMNQTKAEMEQHVGHLRDIVRKAIKAKP
ncbi:MAG: hypothetical protein K8U57_27470 [Planctomycetes bacterium]|nr:hypothetical protein [Planctomycetota bacterium]